MSRKKMAIDPRRKRGDTVCNKIRSHAAKFKGLHHTNFYIFVPYKDIDNLNQHCFVGVHLLADTIQLSIRGTTGQ